jgi:hypothetical protein
MFCSTRRSGLAIAAVLLPIALAGCSSDGEAPGSGTSAAPVSTASAQSTDPAGPAPAPATSGPQVGVSKAPEVKVGEVAKLTSEVRVAVGKIQEITVKAESPGERAGAAVAVPITVRNTSAKPFSLTGLSVTASYDGGTPGDSTTSGPSKELTGALAPGERARGTYVFMVPKKDAPSLRVEIQSNESPTIVQFSR